MSNQHVGQTACAGKARPILLWFSVVLVILIGWPSLTLLARLL